MAQFGQDQRDVGTLSISDIDTNGTYTLDFIPNLDKVPDHLDRVKIPEKVTLAHVNPEQQRIMIYPINTLSDNHNFLKPKYSKIRTIILEGTTYPSFEGWYDSDFDSPSLENPIEVLLDYLPKGFVRDYRYGLGLTQEGNFIINEIANTTNVDTIAFNDSEEIDIRDTVLHFGLSKYHDIIDEIKRIAGRGQRAAKRVKQNFAYNTLAPSSNLNLKSALWEDFPTQNKLHSLLPTMSRTLESKATTPHSRAATFHPIYENSRRAHQKYFQNCAETSNSYHSNSLSQTSKPILKVDTKRSTGRNFSRKIYLHFSRFLACQQHCFGTKLQ